MSIVSIVDDDESVRDATRGFVRSLGYEAAAFASAEEFLSSGRLNDTVCVVADVQMTGLSGIELQSRLAEQAQRIPVIFVTASPEEGIRSRAQAAGAFGYFSKPFDEDLFIGCLDRAVNSATADAIPCEAIMPAEAS